MQTDTYRVLKNNNEKLFFSEICEMNKYMAAEGKDAEQIIQYYQNVCVEVNLKSGKIKVKHNEINLKLSDEDLYDSRKAGFRWVNFNRMGLIVSALSGEKKETKSCVIGWQANMTSGKNIKRLVEVNEVGDWILLEK
jgi:hypothetical protein